MCDVRIIWCGSLGDECDVMGVGRVRCRARYVGVLVDGCVVW